MGINSVYDMRIFFFILGILVLNFACQQEENSQNVKTSKSNKQIIELQEEELNVAGIVSGVYQNTLIAIEKDEISGVYNADKKLKGCQFYFNGHYNPQSKVFDIQLRNLANNEMIDGKLGPIGENINIKTETNFNIKCPDSFNTTGLTVSFIKKANWLKISSVLNKNTEIFEEPDESMGTGIKFKKNELVCILEMKNNWYRVESIGKNTNAGWIKKENIE